MAVSPNQAVFRSIESTAYAMELSVASTRSGLVSIMRSTNEYSLLLACDPYDILARAIELGERVTNTEFANINDYAVFTYLFALGEIATYQAGNFNWAGK